MPGPPASEEVHQLESILEAIDDLRRRVAALEGAAPLPANPEAEAPFAPALPSFSAGYLAALGRLLLAIAGAYLLRAVSEAGFVPPLAGTFLGIVYAAGWLLASLRVAPSAKLLGLMHGIAAAAITAPLVWEATVRFHTLPLWAAAGVLALFVAVGQVTAWRRDDAGIAAITALAGSATALALISATLNPVPFAVALVACAAMIEAGALFDRALAWRWIIALAADPCALLLIYLVTRPQGLPDGYAAVPTAWVLGLLAALGLIYLSGAAIRTAIRRRPIAWFEAAQVVATIAFMSCGALQVTRRSAPILGAFLTALGAACYFVALRGRPMAARNFHAYASAGFIFVLAGTGLLLPSPALTGVWTALALAALWLAKSNTFALHGVAFLLSAAVRSGLLLSSADALVNVASPRLEPPALLCALAIALCCPLAFRLRAFNPATGLLVTALLCFVATGLAAHFVPLTVVTFFICVVALGLAELSQKRNRRELIWLLYPWMVFGAAKILAVDFQQGRPVTVAASFLVYGATLIVLPRLIKRTDS